MSTALVALVLAGCGHVAHAPVVRVSTTRGPLAPPSTGTLRFIGAPAARILPDGEIVVVARLSGRLPQRRTGVQPWIMVDGVDPDMPHELGPSPAPLHGTHDCYAQTARLGPGPSAGQTVIVVLTIPGSKWQRLTATVRLGRAKYNISTHTLARRLGCNRTRHDER
jgi:hypothetical protein